MIKCQYCESSEAIFKIKNNKEYLLVCDEQECMSAVLETIDENY